MHCLHLSMWKRELPRFTCSAQYFGRFAMQHNSWASFLMCEQSCYENGGNCYENGGIGEHQSMWRHRGSYHGVGLSSMCVRAAQDIYKTGPHLPLQSACVTMQVRTFSAFASFQQIGERVKFIHNLSCEQPLELLFSWRMGQGVFLWWWCMNCSALKSIQNMIEKAANNPDVPRCQAEWKVQLIIKSTRRSASQRPLDGRAGKQNISN